MWGARVEKPRLNVPTPVFVLSSGRGSNLRAIQAAIEKGQLLAKIIAVGSDRPQSSALEFARSKGIETFVIQSDQDLVNQIQLRSPRFLICAGYRKILSLEVIRLMRVNDSQGSSYSRIVNVHPSILPSFPGLKSYEKAYQYGVKVTGVTVHLVTEGVDEGPICAQEAFSIEQMHSAEDVEKAGLEIEHRLYPSTLSWILNEAFTLEKRQGRLCVCKS